MRSARPSDLQTAFDSTDAARRAIMRAVKAKDTGPELTVRKLAHRLGFRFGLHRRDLPGRPDLVFAGRRKAIFVNGCFWHGHDCKRGARMPKTNAQYWNAKIASNRARDARVRAELAAAGWTTITIWECETTNVEALRARLVSFLGPNPRYPAR